MYRYEKDGNIFLLKDKNGKTLHGGEEVAIAYSTSPEGAIMHKHGDPVHVRKWVETAQFQFRQAGFPEMAEDMEMVVSSEWSVDDLNWMLDCSGYITKLIDKIKVGS